jgi:hypothetical protein
MPFGKGSFFRKKNVGTFTPITNGPAVIDGSGHPMSIRLRNTDIGSKRLKYNRMKPKGMLPPCFAVRSAGAQDRDARVVGACLVLA